MVMTEKQGGSDLRANTTLAEPIGDGWFELTGHKWFCTHPVFDVFFTLAQTDAGITCFVAERPHPGFRIQRLKDKLGGRCLASSEVEYDHLPARILGEEGRGTAFIVEQLIWTRLDTLHRGHRHDAPRRRRGDLARAPPRRVRRAARRAAGDGQRARRHRAGVRGGDRLDDAHRARVRLRRRPDEVAFRRLALAVMKYWVCKRGAPLAAEALECLGGNGYVEEAPMAQFYRDIQLGTVWEGSGNVIALDVLRALAPRTARRRRRSWPSASSPPAPTRASTPTCARVREAARSARPPTRTAPSGARAGWSRTWRWRCRRACCCATRRRTCPRAFCAARLGERGLAFGDLPRGVDGAAIVERSLAL